MLDFYNQKINVGAQQINDFALETFVIIIADLELENKAGRSKFF